MLQIIHEFIVGLGLVRTEDFWHPADAWRSRSVQTIRLVVLISQNFYGPLTAC